MNITIAGAGYVGFSLALLLAQRHPVTVMDVDTARVETINRGQAPVEDPLAADLLQRRPQLKATNDPAEAYRGAELIIIAVPTNFDERLDGFDTRIAESVIATALQHAPKAKIVIKSTVPIGFTARMQARHPQATLLFSPEFLREGKAIHDNLHPSRIVVGGDRTAGEQFARLMQTLARQPDVPVLLTDTTEAEAIKLFANTYLATRVAFFNEVDNFCLHHRLDAAHVIEGICLDPRIGCHYNNPSFGYGGYCLPKDSRQTVAQFRADGIPQQVMEGAVRSNTLRKQFLAEDILARNPRHLGVYRLAMKAGSDNYRSSATIDLIRYIHAARPELPISIYEPLMQATAIPEALQAFTFVETFDALKAECDLILANRTTPALDGLGDRLYTRDLYAQN